MNTQEEKLRETYNKRSFTKKMLYAKLDEHNASYLVRDSKYKLVDILVEKELELLNKSESGSESEPEPDQEVKEKAEERFNKIIDDLPDELKYRCNFRCH